MRNFLNGKGEIDEALMDKLIILADEIVELIVKEKLSFLQAEAVLEEARVCVRHCKLTR